MLLKLMKPHSIRTLQWTQLRMSLRLLTPKILQLHIPLFPAPLLHRKLMIIFSMFRNGMKHFNDHWICLTPNIRHSFAIVLNSSSTPNIYGERTLKANTNLLYRLPDTFSLFPQHMMMLDITVSSQQMPLFLNIIGGHS